jgi:hypothetical protein
LGVGLPKGRIGTSYEALPGSFPAATATHHTTMIEYDDSTEPCTRVVEGAAELDPDRPETTVVSTTEHSEDGPDECTLFPCNLEGVDLMTTWITARGNSFVDLESMR